MAAQEEPRYLTPYQLAGELDADPEKVRDWLKREPARGRDHTAPPDRWLSPTQRTYDAASAAAAWRARPGKGGRPRKTQ
jgi:hypothetical protein